MANKNVSQYRPNEEDKEWLREVLESLKDDGRLITDIAVYRKRNKVLRLVSVSPTATTLGLSPLDVQRELHKMERVANSIGYQFKDLRPEIWN